MAAKPLINTTALSEFGDLTETAAFHDPTLMDRDMSYVPGFSEMRRNQAIKMAEYAAGKCAKEDIPFLPVNLRWARVQNRAGQTDTSKAHAHGGKGYKFVNVKEHVGQDWLKALPPGAEQMADGTIRRGDTALMWCPREAAAKSELAKRVQTEQRLTGTESVFLQNLQNQAAKGADPVVEKMDQGQPVFGKKQK